MIGDDIVLTPEEIKRALESVEKLQSMDDYDKLDYLEYLKLENVNFQIVVDNDDVMICFGEDADGDSINCSFYDNGYHLLPILFQRIGFDSDFV